MNELLDWNTVWTDTYRRQAVYTKDCAATLSVITARSMARRELAEARANYNALLPVGRLQRAVCSRRGAQGTHPFATSSFSNLIFTTTRSLTC